jgi:hypothetical protein
MLLLHQYLHHSQSKASDSDLKINRNTPIPPELPFLGVLECFEAINPLHDWALVAIDQKVAQGLSTQKFRQNVEKLSEATARGAIASKISTNKVFAVTDEVISGTISSTQCSVNFGTKFVDHWSVMFQRPLGESNLSAHRQAGTLFTSPVLHF